MSKILNTIILILLGIITLAVIGVIFLLIYPTKVADYNFPYKVHPDKVEAGETIFYTSAYCKYLPIKAEVTRTIVDGTVVFLPVATTNLKTGCNKVDIPVEIPLNTPPGEYYIDITLTYKVNFLRDIVTKVHTEKFQVTNPCLTKVKPCS